MGDLVSIIMPAYNSERYIADSIDSVLAQTYTDWELIIVDDCSDDGTAEVVKRYGDERIKYYFSEKNLGVAGARNYGVQRSKGRWIAFLDSDDLWRPKKLEIQAEFAKENKDSSLIFTASAYIGEAGDSFEYIFHVPKEATKRELFKQNVISCSSVFVLKEYMQKFPFCEDEMIHEDYVTWLRILDVVGVAHGIDVPLLVYRLRPNSKSRNKVKAAKMQWNAYKEYGLKFFQRAYYMACYGFRGIMKNIRLYT